MKYQQQSPQGSIVGTIQDDIAVVDHIHTSFEHTRKGVATDLYRGFERYCIEKGCGVIYLQVFEKNIIGKKFWANLGFEFTGEICEQEYETWRKEV